jgi:hypothetical protein
VSLLQVVLLVSLLQHVSGHPEKEFGTWVHDSYRDHSRTRKDGNRDQTGVPTHAHRDVHNPEKHAGLVLEKMPGRVVGNPGK